MGTASRIRYCASGESGEGEAWWWFGGLATIKATQEQTGGRYTLVEILVPEFPAEEGLLHVHHFEDEGFYSSKER